MEEMKEAEQMVLQLDAEEQADNTEGISSLNEIMSKLNSIAGEELQTDEQIDAAEKQLLAELDEDGEDIEDLMTEMKSLDNVPDDEEEEDDEEDLQLDGPVGDWNKGICM